MPSTTATQGRSCPGAGFLLPSVGVFQWLQSCLTRVMGGESTPSPASPQTGQAFATLHTPDFNPSYAALGKKRVIWGLPQGCCDENLAQ